MFYNYLGFYGENLKCAKMEQFIDKKGKTEEFRRVFEEKNGSPWVESRDAFAFFEDDVVDTLVEVLGMSETAAHNWFDGTETVETSIAQLVSEMKEYVDAKPKNFRLLFMIDEVGQYVGDSIDLLMNLQSLVEKIGSECNGKIWVVCTGQEEMCIRDRGGPLALGLHKKGSTYDVLTASDCKIVHEDLNRILSCVLEYFRSRGGTYYHKLTHEGYLRHLLVRRSEATGEILTALVTSSQEEWDLELLAEQICSLPLEGRLAGVLHMINDSLADVVKSDETRVLWGQDYFYEKILGLQFKVTPFSFFQTNSQGAEVLYETAREMIGDVENATVFDLYSGTGTIAQMLAPVAGRVIGVEIVEEAVEAAKENAELNGLHNCSFLAGDVLKVLDEIQERPDFIVLDPPREGIHPKALPKIIEFGVERMVYISCKPTSLARDLEIILQNGYRVERMSCVDMFPGTVHVETVCLLGKRKPDTTVKIGIDMEDYRRIRDEEKAE